jgi:ABC-type sugar transport system substrate-binding protein
LALTTANTKVEGDGVSEGTITDQISSVNACDGYAINMITTTSTKSYLDKIAAKLGATEAAPTSVPVIFWNRQGTTADGAVDSAVMADARFKTVLYVGFDAQQGGTLQGEMIKQYITDNIATLTK